MTYITAAEAGEKWNIGTRRICILCKEGRIPGAVKKSHIWMIPENAKKPEDGRKTNAQKGIEPSVLIFNPTYFDKLSIEPNDDERAICEIQKKYMSGQLMEAYCDINKRIILCKDNKYKFIYIFLKTLIGADLGEKEVFSDGLEKIIYTIQTEKEFEIEKILWNHYYSQLDLVEHHFLQFNLYDEFMPLMCLLIFKKTINAALKSGEKIEISALEILCRNLDAYDTPLITAYCHLFLAIYYNILDIKELYEYHMQNVTGILLPRKWYTPLAQYSITIELDFLDKLDNEAYKKVSELSELIIDGYVQSGVFSDIYEKPKLRKDINIKVVYKLVQGKSIEEIANEMSISQYKVKKHIEDFCFATGISSKKDIKSYIIRNLFI